MAKFESKVGLGEIVEHNVMKGGQLIHSELYEVVGVVFDKDGQAVLARHPSSGHVIQFKPSELNGDPNFDQETQSYPEETSE